MEPKVELVAGAGFPLMCISCQQAIRKGEYYIKSRHGLYHGSPYTCVDGRKESRRNR